MESTLRETALVTSKVTYLLGPLDSIPPGEGRTFQIEDLKIAIFRTHGGFLYATQATCPHRGGPLADGIMGAGKVICPLHAYTFDLATGQPIGHVCEAIKTYPVSVGANGTILLTLEQ